MREAVAGTMIWLKRLAMLQSATQFVRLDPACGAVQAQSSKISEKQLNDDN
jgi:hypothetical protein